MSGTARPWGAPRSSAPADGGQALDARQRPRVADHAVDRRNGGRQWRGQERPPALGLAALEVAVRRADRVLPGRELVAVHRDTHRAAGLTPLGTGGPEDLVQALPLGLTLHLVGAGDDHHPDAVGDLAITEDFGRQAEVADPAGAWGRPATYSNVVSSGAIRPARAPPSIDMLQIVIRCSIVRARMASPVYSSTWPVPPPTPIRAMRARMMSLLLTPATSRPSIRTS